MARYKIVMPALMLLWIVTLASSAEAQIRHVLLLHSLDRATLTLDYLTGNFRADVDRLAGSSVRFTQFVVSPSGFEVSPENAIVEFLQSAFSDQPRPDLVMTIGGPAAAFARKHR